VARCSQAPSSALDGGAEAGDAATEASTCQPPTTQDTMSCPPLVEPECDARLLDGCPEQACASGCEGFLRCEKGDWSAAYVAYCDEDGNLVKMP
jgi:hypothetical protein